MIAALLVFIGGGLGSLTRYAVSQCLSFEALALLPPPRATLFSNVVSCLILGVLLGLNEQSILSSRYRLLLVTGFCGGFSTFSTFSAEILDLLQSNQWMSGMVYIFLSLFLGVLSIVFTFFITKYVITQL